MKKLFAITILILGFVMPCFALTATETKKDTATEITITFTQDEYDLFSLDKGDPKEWIRNVCDINLQDHTQRIKADLIKDIKPTEQDFKATVELLKVEKEKIK